MLEESVTTIKSDRLGTQRRETTLESGGSPSWAPSPISIDAPLRGCGRPDVRVLEETEDRGSTAF